MAGEQASYNAIDSGKVANKEALLELCNQIKQYISNNSSGGSSIRIINYSNLADSTSADYIFLDNIRSSWAIISSHYYIDYGSLFCIRMNSTLYYPCYAFSDSNNAATFAGFLLIGTTQEGRISTRKLNYNAGTWSLSTTSFVYAPTAGTGIAVNNGVISLDLTNANGVSY